MHDGATCHTSKSTTFFLQQRGIRVLPNWPSQSPDLNLIENIWQTLKAKVALRKSTTLNKLWEVTQQEWDKIPSEFIKKTV